MVGNHTHCHIILFIFTIFSSGHFSNLFNDWLENVRIIIRSLTLQCHTQAFESHTGIDYFCRKTLQTSIRFTVELHEYQVPNFDYLRVIMVYQIMSAYLGTFFGRAQINMNLRTRSTWPCISHFPKVIMLITIYNMIFRKKLFPIAGSFIITFQSFFRTSFKNSSIKIRRVQL